MQKMELLKTDVDNKIMELIINFFKEIDNMRAVSPSPEKNKKMSEVYDKLHLSIEDSVRDLIKNHGFEVQMKSIDELLIGMRGKHAKKIDKYLNERYYFNESSQ